MIVTPELVRPIPAGQPVPDLNYADAVPDHEQRTIAMRQPGMDKTGPVPVQPPSDSHAVRAMVQQAEGQAPAHPPNPSFSVMPPAPTRGCARTAGPAPAGGAGRSGRTGK